MGVKKTSQVEIVFDGLVQLLKNRQQQLEFLLEERKILEDRIKTQQERWVSDVRLCKDQISQMKDSLVEKDMAYSLLSAKSALMVGLKRREVSLLKLKLEQTEDELGDNRAGFGYLSHILEKSSNKTNKGNKEVRQSNLNSSASKNQVSEIKRLKSEYEKLSSEKNSEISALVKEKSFIWNQYNVLESDLTDKLKSKESEITLANTKIAKLIGSAESLQSSINQKDEKIGILRSKLIEMEVDRDKMKGEVSRLTHELKSMKESKNAPVTPVLRKHGAKSSLSKGSNVIVKKEIPSGKPVVPVKDGEKGCRSSKRKLVEEISVLETPKLFSNTFKIPKLKTPSVPVT